MKKLTDLKLHIDLQDFEKLNSSVKNFENRKECKFLFCLIHQYDFECKKINLERVELHQKLFFLDKDLKNIEDHLLQFVENLNLLKKRISNQEKVF